MEEITDTATKLAVLTALKKMLDKAKDATRADMQERMESLHSELGVSSVDLAVGGEKVGRVSLGNPRVSIGGGDDFAEWAHDRGMGSLLITIDTDELGSATLDGLIEHLDTNAIDYRLDYKASPEAKKGLKVVGGRVVTAEGELVSGAYAVPPRIHVTGCEPEDVGHALRLSGDNLTVAGILGEPEDE